MQVASIPKYNSAISLPEKPFDVHATIEARPAAQASRENPQRQFVFIADGQLQDAPAVRHLLRFLEPVSIDVACYCVLERFLADDELYAVPVVDRLGRPVALVDRRRWLEFFGKPYTRELFGRRNVFALLDYDGYENLAPIVVEDSCSVEDVAKMVIDAGVQHMVTGVLICSSGRYVGVVNGHDLLNVITQRKQAELYYLAQYDSLTGIPNRALLSDRLGQACRDATRKGTLAALLFIDVDRFKQINDALGHSAGDSVLREIVSRLKSVARRTDTVARLAGDEFVILMEDFANPAEVALVAGRVVQSMQQPIDLLGHSLVVTVSVGSAIYPTDDTDINSLLAKGDAAMYEAKANGRNGYRRFSSRTTMFNPARMVLENDLRQAMERDELILYFQPQVRLGTQEVVGVEALVRWRHPVRGLVPPVEFIPVAEESGLIISLGTCVLHQAFRQIRIWQAQGLPPLRIAVNISALQFQQRNFPALLKSLVTQYEVDTALVELELTEGTLMRNADEVVQRLKEIKAIGFSLSIDDFGTGYSSLSYLRRFPIDRLKIDQSFVRDIQHTPVNESIARTIVALAKSLSLEITAEGIEKPAEKALLELMGCSEGQGYLFGKPQSVDDFTEWFVLRCKNRPGALSGGSVLDSERHHG